MRILVVSDIENKYIWDHFDPDKFRGVELIISCGDLSARYLSFLVTMIPCPLLYVPGNHDKKYETAPPEGCINIDERLLVYRGIRIMGLGGCKSPHPCLHEYSEQQMWKKVTSMERQIRRAKGLDIFVSHAPAIGLGDFDDQFHRGFESFRYIDDKYKPDIHMYGHCHMGENPMDRRACYPYHSTVMLNGSGYKLIDYTPGCEFTHPMGCIPFEEIPTPMPPRRFPAFFR